MTKNNLELIEFAKHKQIKINNQHYHRQENQQNAVSVMVSELSTLVHEYPVFITKSPDTGQFQLSALLGLKSGENLFIQNEKWQATYIPMDIQRRPFQLYIPPGTKGRGHIALDVSSPQVNEQVGPSVYDDNGKPSPYFEQIKQLFALLMSGQEQTCNVLAVAAKHDLLEPITINIEQHGEQVPMITGIYGFNQKKVTELSGEALEECHHTGCLQVCHLVLSSGIHIQKLLRWSKASEEANNEVH